MATIEFAFEQDKTKLSCINQIKPVNYDFGDKLYLAKDIYWIRGATKSVIHDLRLGILYILDEGATKYLHQILDFSNTDEDEMKPFINQLLHLKLLTTDAANISDNNLLSRIEKPYKISRAYVEVTNQCNLRCRHCYNVRNENNKKFISLSDFDYTLKKISDAGIPHICIIGGEPFLCREDYLRHIINQSSNNFEKVTIFSNGTLLNEDIIEFLSNYDNVILSIPYYSENELVHDHFTCRKGSHTHLSKNLEILDKYGIKYNLTGIYCKDVCESGCQKSKKVMAYDYVRLSGRGSLELYSDALLMQRLKTFESLSHEWTLDAISKLYNNRCFARLIYITANLNVYPCSMERRICHGNLREIDITKLQPEIINFSNANVNGCSNCEFRFICSNCPPDSLHGNLFEKPWMCCYCPNNGTWLAKEDKIRELYSDINQSSIYMSK